MANSMKFRLLAALGVTVVTGISAQGQQPPSSAPFSYPGMPTTPYGPDWQAYYEVTAPLPNITFPLPRTYAGSVSVNRTGHVNDTLFFVAYEKEDGSLAAADGARANEPWTIWLNGGPGSSSMYGLFTELGPLHFSLDATGTNLVMYQNPYSWHNLTDIFFIDQPVGTGYSTAESDGYIADEDQMGRDFTNFLGNIVSIFPSLKQRPLYITGESYAGTYIPYIAKTILATTPAPVNLAKIVIGDGSIGNYGAFVEYSTVAVMQTYPQLFGFDTNVYEYFVEQYNLCGYNLTLHYPASSDYPTLRASGRLSPNSPKYHSKNLDAMARMNTLLSLYKLNKEDTVDGTAVVNGKMFVKRQNDAIPPPPLAPTGIIDPHYQCFVMEHLEDYATNYTAPWKGISFDVYRVADALSPPAPEDPGFFLNDPAVQAAFHAPNKTWSLSISYPFNSSYSIAGGNEWGDPSPESQLLLSDLSKHIPMAFYSGNDDALVAHRGTELAIQNTTFGGIRGFTARPSTPFSDTDGNFAGIIHQERNVTYALFYGAGHMVPAAKPKSAYAFVRDFVLGSNDTGLVVTSGGTTNVIGGVHTEYENGILTASGVLTGSLTTAGTYTWPADKWAAWGSYMATRTAADVPVASAVGDGVISPGSQNGNSSGAMKAQQWTIGAGVLCGISVALFGLF